MSTLGVGIIGLGISSPEPWPGYVWTSTRNGLDHADAIDRTDKLHVRALCDIAEGPLEKIARDRGVAWYTDYRDLLDNDEIDIVTVATPNGFHAQMARDALEAGKHVLLEKPMCITLEECESLIATVEATGRTLLVNHIQRFSPRFMETRRLAHSGALGDLYYGESAVIRNTADLIEYGWRGQGEHAHNPMLGNGSHAFDLLRWIFGEVSDVYAVGTSRNAGDLDVPFDMCDIAVVRFESGAVGKVLGNHICAGPMVYQLEVWGTEGTIIDDRMYLRTQHEEAVPFTLLWDPLHPYDPIYQHLAECILTNKQPLIDVYEGANTVSVALAAVESIGSAKPVEPHRFARAQTNRGGV